MATVSKRFTSVFGPAKMEVISLTAVTSADTVTTTMQGPSFGFFVANGDSSITQETQVAISGRTVTLTNSQLSADTGVLIVFGF